MDGNRAIKNWFSNGWKVRNKTGEKQKMLVIIFSFIEQRINVLLQNSGLKLVESYIDDGTISFVIY